MDFEAARRNADERLNQELIRIRNLPKRSKIEVANKYGLKHASHTNAGLLKELETNLSVISREQRQVAKECDKRQRDFKETQKKSLSRFLPPLAQEEKETVEAMAETKDTKGTGRRASTIFDQTPLWMKGRRESMTEWKRGMLLDMTARSKEKTFKIISENNKKTSIGAPLPPLHDVKIDKNSWITRLNRRRKNAYTGSCFPFLLEESEHNRERENYGEKNPNQNQQFPRLGPKNDSVINPARTFRTATYEKVIRD